MRLRSINRNFLMKKIILLFILFFHFVCLSAAQGMDETPLVIYRLNNNDRKYIIAEIKIKGVENCGYEDYVLTNMCGLSIGDKVSIPGDEITFALKTFLKQKLYSYGEILTTKQTADSVWLEIVLHPNPIVSGINFMGVEKSEQEELEDKIGIVRGLQLTPDLIGCIEKRVKDFFIKKGFSNTEVKIQQKNDIADAGKKIINIMVNRNLKVKVRYIHIVGNNVLSDYALKVIMKNTNERFSLRERLRLSLRKLFSTKKFIKERYDKDVEDIILRYNEKGYRDARIVSDSIVLLKEDQIDIYLTINEGSKYYFRNINWVGNTLYSSENLNHILNIRLGDVYDLKKLNSRLLTDRDAVSNLYHNNGYIFSSMNPIEVCVENDSVDVEVCVLEGIQATINRVSINGNVGVYEDIIRRELATKPGQLFSKEAIMYSTQKIAQMGYFEQELIDVQPIFDSETGMVDINYNLTSKVNDQIEFSTGWGGNNGIIGRLNLKFSNFSVKNLIHPKEYNGIIPQGDGQILALDVQTGIHSKLYKISFLEPWMGAKRPNRFLFNIGYEKTKRQNASLSICNLSASYSKLLSWLDNYSTFTSDLSYRCYWPENWQDFPYGNIQRAHNLTFGFTLSRNSTDNLAYPRYGSIFSLSLNATPPYSLWDIVGSKSPEVHDKWIEYYKWKFKGSIFVPLFNREKVRYKPVLMSGVEYGFVGSYNKNSTLFGTFCIGSNTIPKDYDFNEKIGLRGYLPPDEKEHGANAYTKLTLELRYPFVLEQAFTVYSLIFMEAGGIMEDEKYSFGLKRSTGVGIRILLPMIGLMGLDWAYGFDEPFGIDENKSSGFHIHFIFGKEF